MKTPWLSWESRTWWMAAVLLLLVYLATVPRQWQCEGLDEIEYLALAHSLSSGFGYTIYGEPHVLYPPVYAALLSLPWRLTDGDAWPIYYGLNAALGAVGLLWLGAQIRRRAGAAGRWASWLLVTAYYPWSFSTRYLLSEPLFLLFSAALLAAVEQLRSPGTRRSRGLALAAAALTVALAGATRFAAVTLVAGVVAALVLDGMRRRALRLVLAGFLLGGVGLSILVGWEVRAARVAPQARESYGKWVQALTGSGGEAAQRLAARSGEGVAAEAGWVTRAGLESLKIGQFVLSAPRVTPHFSPLGALLCALMIGGLLARLRADPGAPEPWYVAITLLVVSLTSWVSSYHRYLYPLAPFLFLYLVEGVQAVWRMRARAGLRIGFALAGAGALAGWYTAGRPAMGAGAEGVYAAVLSWCVLAVPVALVALAIRPWPGRAAGLGVAFVLLLALQNGGLLAVRFRQTLGDATPEARQLLGLRASCAWLRQSAAPGDRILANLPVVTSFLSGRVVRGPDPYWPDGAWVVLSGPLQDMPAYRADRETRLREALPPTASPPLFSSRASVVYRVRPP